VYFPNWKQRLLGVYSTSCVGKERVNLSKSLIEENINSLVETVENTTQCKTTIVAEQKQVLKNLPFILLLIYLTLATQGVEGRAHLLSSGLKSGLAIISQPLYEEYQPFPSERWRVSVDCVCIGASTTASILGAVDYCPCFSGVSYQIPETTNMCNSSLDIIYSKQFEFDNTVMVSAANLYPIVTYGIQQGVTYYNEQQKTATFHNEVEFDVAQGTLPKVWCCFGVISGNSAQCQLSASPVYLGAKDSWYDYLFGKPQLTNKQMHALNGNIKGHKQVKQNKHIKKEVKAIRRALIPSVRGRGDYAEDAGQWLGKKTGGIIGGELGNASTGESWGGKAGKWLGGKARDIFKGIFGLGDYNMPGYKTQKNSLLNGGNDPPIVSNVTREIMVTHREFIQNIVLPQYSLTIHFQ
jgi:hypothetical protein